MTENFTELCFILMAKLETSLRPENVETIGFLHLHPIDEIEFHPSEYVEALEKTCGIKPVLANFQCSEPLPDPDTVNSTSLMSPSPVKRRRTTATKIISRKSVLTRYKMIHQKLKTTVVLHKSPDRRSDSNELFMIFVKFKLYF